MCKLISSYPFPVGLKSPFIYLLFLIAACTYRGIDVLQDYKLEALNEIEFQSDSLLNEFDNGLFNGFTGKDSTYCYWITQDHTHLIFHNVESGSEKRIDLTAESASTNEVIGIQVYSPSEFLLIRLDEVSFYKNDELVWSKNQDSIIPGGFITPMYPSNSVFEVTDEHLTVLVAGEYDYPNKRYPFDFRIFGKINTSNGKGKMVNFTNPDFGDNSLKLSEINVINLPNSTKLGIRYGADYDVYLGSAQGGVVQQANYQLSKQDSMVFTDIKRKNQSLTNYLVKDKFSDFYLLESRDLVISIVTKQPNRAQAKVQASDTAFVLVYNTNLELIDLIPFEAENFSYPCYFANEKIIFRKSTSKPNAGISYLAYEIKTTAP